ncbi:MAG: type II toxin-antitoxin system HicB family antitoxin [Fimbriimonadales bacterium]
MELKIVGHEEGRYLAEVPAIPGCATGGEETWEDLLTNLAETVERCHSELEA